MSALCKREKKEREGPSRGQLQFKHAPGALIFVRGRYINQWVTGRIYHPLSGDPFLPQKWKYTPANPTLRDEIFQSRKCVDLFDLIIICMPFVWHCFSWIGMRRNFWRMNGAGRVKGSSLWIRNELIKSNDNSTLHGAGLNFSNDERVKGITLISFFEYLCTRTEGA